IEVEVHVTNGGTNADSRWQFTGPSGCTGRTACYGMQTNITSTTGSARDTSSTIGGAAMLAGGFAGTVPIRLTCVAINGATAGTIQLKAAQGTSAVESVVVED